MLKSINYKKFLPFNSIYLITVILSFFYLGNLIAQVSNNRDNRQLVIGDLSGRTDAQTIEVFTTNGYKGLLFGGDDKPFEIIKNTPTEIELQFNPSYGLQPNNPNKLVYRLYESERALISALILEDVDFAILENEVSASEVGRANSHFRPWPRNLAPNTVKLVCYNHRNRFLKPRNVRVALAYGINHNHIIKKIILGGKANLAKGPFDEDSPLYSSGLESYKYNPKMAIKLLRQAGWFDTNGDGILDKDGIPFTITLLFQKGVSLDEAISRQIKINLLKIGVNIIPKPSNKKELNQHLDAGDFDAVLLEHRFENNIQSLEDFFSTEGANNYMGYRSNSFENYLKIYYELKDSNKKRTLIKSMQRVINMDQPVNFLYFKWLTHYMVNIYKFENYQDSKGNIKPFDEWIIKNLDEK